MACFGFGSHYQAASGWARWARAWKNVAQCLEKRRVSAAALNTRTAAYREPVATAESNRSGCRVAGGSKQRYTRLARGGNFAPMGVQSGAPQAIDWA